MSLTANIAKRSMSPPSVFSTVPSGAGASGRRPPSPSPTGRPPTRPGLKSIEVARPSRTVDEPLLVPLQPARNIAVQAMAITDPAPPKPVRRVISRLPLVSATSASTLPLLRDFSRKNERTSPRWLTPHFAPNHGSRAGSSQHCLAGTRRTGRAYDGYFVLRRGDRRGFRWFARRPDVRPLQAHRPARPGRHGRGVPGGGHKEGADRCAEDPRGAVLAGREVQDSIPARVARGRGSSRTTRDSDPRLG